MTPEPPSISVIIPVYNGAKFLRLAVDSILAQRDNVLEILVIDDGSTDDTPVIARDLPGPVTYVRQENAGPSAARNTGLGLAQGSFIAFLDADDLWPAGGRDALLRCLLTAPESSVAIGTLRHIDEAGTLIEPSSAPISLPLMLGTALYRREVFERVGRFTPDLLIAQDWDFYVRLCEAHEGLRQLDVVTLLYRRHPGSRTLTKEGTAPSIMTMLKRSIDRRRQEDGAVLKLNRATESQPPDEPV